MQYIPFWLSGMISPLLNMIGDRIPSIFKPAVLLAGCAAIMVAVVFLTPMGWPEFPVEMWALYCLVTGAYTLAKPIEDPRIKVGPAITTVVAGLAIMALPFIAIAQVVDTSTAADTAGSSVPAVIGSLVGAFIARLLKRWIR